MNNPCRGCDATGLLRVDGVPFATCEACDGKGHHSRERPKPSGLGLVGDQWLFAGESQANMAGVQAAVRARQKRRKS